MGKNAGKKRVTRRTVIEESGAGAEEIGGDELDLDGGDDAADPADPGESDALGKLRDLAGGDTACRYEVKRTLPSNQAGYVGTIGAEELTMEQLAELFGPGRYTIRVRMPGGKYGGSDNVQIAEPARPKLPPATPAPAAPPVAPGNSDLALVLAAMQRSADQQATNTNNLLRALIERPQPAAPAQPDTIGMLLAAQKLLGPRDANGGMDMFLKGIEFGKEIGGSGGETDFGDLMLKGIDGLKELSAAQPAQATPRRRLPAPGTVPAIEHQPAAAPRNPRAAAPTAGAKMNTLQLLQWLGGQVKRLLVLAANNKSPSLYAEVFLDGLPPGLEHATILEHLNKPDAIQQLARLDKRVLHFAPWFEEFRGEVLRMIEEGPEDDGDDEDGDDEDDATAPGAVVADIPPEFPQGGEDGGGAT